MIDFPTLYPNLVKYLPNWLERFYPSLAQFARGEGYPCGNQGVFIPRRNKCWTHPKTGTRLKKPLTYQMYKDAKEKSQKSRTEKGRAALETREQGFRDKAREKVKGWQKNKPQPETTQTEVKPTPQPPVNIPPVNIPPVDKPINFEETRGVIGRLINGDITAKEARAHYERVKNSEEVLKQDLSKLKKDELKGHYGGYFWSGAKKGELVDKVYDSILSDFNLSGSVVYDPFSAKGNYRIALDKAVDTSLTDENIQQKAGEYRARREARKAEITKIKKAIDDPQSLEDFELKGKYAKDKTLTPEQQRRYDQLIADTNKQKRGEELEKKAVVSGVNKEGIKMSLKQTTHAKKGHDLYVATLDERVERNTYDELNSRAKQLGGYYSSFKGLGAIPGFQFKDEESARKFMSLEEVKSDRLEQQKEQQQVNNAERLKQLAEKTEESASEKLNQDRLTNTARRARMASSVEARARGELQLAQTLSNIAEATERGELKYLDKVSNKAQVEQLDDILVQSHYERARKESKQNYNDSYSKYKDITESPITDESIDYAKYPYPSIRKSNVLDFAKEFQDTPGLKKISKKLLTRYKEIEGNEKEYQIKFEDEEDIKQLNLMANKAILRGDNLKSVSKYTASELKESLGDYNRLKGMGITNDSELRVALREYNGLRGKKKQADPTKELERDLVGVKIPGYFPTPDALADRLVEQADIKPGMKVLEPSAGKGSLVDAVRRKYSKDDVEVTPIELDSRLNKILKAKGYNPMQEDFMSLKEKDKYDRIVMNPPFENGQDMDHVRHAYDMLKPGGKIVAIMGEGGFFRGDKKSQEFRSWLNDKGVSDPLPAGSFKTSDNPTGVNTRLVTIQKGSKPKANRSELDPDEADKLLQVKDMQRKNDFNSNFKLAQFTSYPCGNKGVFIPSSKNCYTHPKTGVKLDKPLKFKDYVQARKEAYNKSKSGQPLTETEQQLLQDVNRLQGKVSDKRRAKDLNNAAKRMGAKAILPSGIAEADPNKIKVDPKRFQYKIIGEQTKSGEVGSLSGVKKWDANLGGILQVWRDPRDGEVFVVNGHNRLALAKKLDAPSVTVKLIDAKSPQEARAIGALTNIAEGRGNAQDAAKFFRDSGVTKQELEKKGVPMREKIAEDGLALANLSDSLFNRVVQGQIPEQRAVVIGSKIKDHRQQQDLLELVEKQEKRGKKITNDTIEELSDMVTNAPTKTESQGGLLDLLGFTPETRSLALEKAQVQAAIKRKLSQEKRLFSIVGKSKAAQDLAKAGNEIKVEESKEVADVAEKALSAFDQEKMLTGKVSTLLNQAAERLAGNQKGQDKIIKETYEQVLDELQKTYRFGKGSGSKGTEGLSKSEQDEAAIQRKRLEDFEKAKKAGQMTLFNKYSPNSKPTSASFGCCCEASKSLRRRKSKQTPKLRRRGNKYA